MFGLTGILAHQGGWDEMLMVAAPIAIFVVLLKVANTRAGKLGAEAGAATLGADDDPNGRSGRADGPPKPTRER